MDVNQLSREELQTVALENCPAELFYELNDQIDEVNEGLLSVLAEHKVGDGLTPYLLGRLAFWQDIISVIDDPLMMDFWKVIVLLVVPMLSISSNGRKAGAGKR